MDNKESYLNAKTKTLQRFAGIGMLKRTAGAMASRLEKIRKDAKLLAEARDCGEDVRIPRNLLIARDSVRGLWGDTGLFRDNDFRLISPDLEGFVTYLKEKEVKSLIVLIGAGVSVAAGIPDFRSKNGL